jgi:Domain of unknown function (DUF4440)
MMRLSLAVFIPVLLFAPGAAQTQTAPQVASGRAVVATRLVAMFSDLETQWLTAVQNKNTAVLDHLLSDEFQVWIADPPGAPLPREDWQAHALAAPPSIFHLRQMAVRPVSDDIAIASFVLQESMTRDGKDVSQQQFIVDVWKKTAESWLCTDRYSSDIAKNPMPQANKKPTGKQ